MTVSPPLAWPPFSSTVEGTGRNGVRKRESQPRLKQPTPSAQVQPSAFSTFRQTALQPCNNQNREKQEDSSTEADSTQSHTIGLHCSLTHSHSCREKKEGILTGPAWLGTQFQNLGKKQRKEKKGKKCEAQRNLETHPKQTI